MFQRVHIDFTERLLFFVAIDFCSKWPFVTVTKSTTVEKTINAIRQLFATDGISEQLVLDNGSQLTSEAFAVFVKMNDICHS